MNPPIIHTVGHSTHTLQELSAILLAHGVAAVADVRSIPRSRHVPQFNADHLAAALPVLGLAYLPFPSLGGRRHTRRDSINLAWRNTSFRGYADYMQTPAFTQALEELMTAARQTPIALMCAEAVPWRCHRSLIGDALLVRGWTVLDIMSRTQAKPHRLTSFAHVEGLTITYPAPPEPAGLFEPPRSN